MHHIKREQLLPVELPEIYNFFSQARNLERLTPPWLRFEVLTPEPIEMRAGTLISYRLRLHGVPMRWVTRIDAWEPGRRFVDRQLRGPYKVWEHTHEFIARADGTLVRDHVRYALPFGPFGALAHVAFVKRDLERVFEYRRDAVQQLLSSAPAQA